MEGIMDPLESVIDFKSGLLKPFENKVARKLSDMQGMYLDDKALESIVNSGDDVVYKVFERKVPLEEGHLVHSTTVIYPGKVGEEYYMTKGHFHTKEDRSELYLGVQGEGYVIMQTKEGKVSLIRMKPGVVAYIPPYWAHRTINIGKNIFAFFTVYPADAGHNYGSIEETGFPKLVLEKDGRPTIVDNPNYR